MEGQSTWQERLREIPSGIWALGFVSMLMDISSETIHALLPLYLVTVLGTPTLTVGLIEGLDEATAAVTRIFSGVVSDWIGRRKVLAATGYCLGALTKPVFPLASTVSWVIAARLVDRLGKGIRGAPRDALVADLAPDHLRGASFGLRQSLDTVGAFIGPVLALVLMWKTGDDFKAVFWAAVVPAFLAVALIVVAVHEPERPMQRRHAQSPLRFATLRRLGSSYWAIVWVGAVFTLARFSEAFLVLRAQSIGLPIRFAPAVMIVMNVAYMLSAYPAGLLSDRIDRVSVLMIGFVLLISANTSLALSQDVAVVMFGVVLWGLHMGLTQGLLATLIADIVPVDLRGTAYGVFNLVAGIAILVASVTAGRLWDVWGPEATFTAGAGFTALALAGLFRVRHRMRGAQPGRRGV